MESNDNASTSSSAGSRKYFTAEQKFKIIKEQLTTKTAVTEICKKYEINATQFYRWQEQFFTSALEGFGSAKRASGSAEFSLRKKCDEQERELKRREMVIIELATENITLKKSPGVLSLIK